LKHKPIKRNIALQPISREHHFGLLLCWKIRTGFKYDIEPIRIWDYVQWFYEKHLIPHFEFEEKHIFPLLGDLDSLVDQALYDHQELHKLCKQECSTEVLSEIESKLEAHIRFEERVLFNKLQDTIDQSKLDTINNQFEETAFEENTQDVFWK